MGKILIASDSFKGAASALEVCNAIENGIKQVCPKVETIKIPMADGGEGTVESLIAATKGKLITKTVTNPLGEKVKAKFGILGDNKTAVIEMAEASGLPLVPPGKRNPLKTTTYGTGELIKYALEKGCRRFIIGIGGSATVDGGAGMAQALGAKLVDRRGREIGFGGGSLSNLFKIDISSMDERIKACDFEVACDVRNPLCGSNGAAYVYGSQKGATKAQIPKLDEALSHFASVIRRDIGVEVENLAGAGAAGGLGAGLVAFLGAHLKSGIELVMNASGIEHYIQEVDLVITGEGKIDGQTIFGKTPIGVAKLAKKYGKPVIAVCGMVDEGYEEVYKNGIDAIITEFNSSLTTQEQIGQCKGLIQQITANAMRLAVIAKLKLSQ
ncbi:MAG: glycerate kinase [bacterium]|nr:glycerate kinase [bacterium]